MRNAYAADPVCGRSRPEYPAKLNSAEQLARFVRHVLPGVMSQMRDAHGWTNLPRTIVHDKASYMVSPSHQRLNATFVQGLADGGFTSWLGGVSDTTEWLVPKWGDVYLHETVISHIRRLLEEDYRTSTLNEPVARFKSRMELVAAHMNSPAFSAAGGRGLCGLARDLRWRCEEVVKRKGERLPK
jgi:hypothetical protein